MVLQKRLYYGFDGGQAPPIPRGPRSLRKRGPLRKKSVDNEMCAFDLLASVADKILLNQQSPTTASSDGMCHEGSIPGIVKEERQLDDHKLVGFHNQGNPEIGLDVVEITNNEGGFCSGSASTLTNSGYTDKTGFDEKKAFNDGMCHEGIFPGSVKEERQLDDHKLVSFQNQGSPEIGLDMVEITNNEGGFSSGSASTTTNSGCTDKTGFDEKKPLNDHGKENSQSQIVEASFGFGSDTISSEDLEFLDRNLSKSDKYVYNTSVRVHGDHYTCGYPSPCNNNVNLLVRKDDDDNSSECTKRSTVMKTIGDRRIKKLVASRCSRAPAKMTTRNLSDSGVAMHTVYQSRRRGSKCQRSQRIYPFKKRKLLHTTSDDTTRCDYEDIYEPLEKATNISASDFETSESPEAGHSALFTPRESIVKLRIQSFRVPELFIELPETANVGSLKKTAMDAIKTLLGNGLHIGVLVQGREVKDDNLTLLQSGISHDTLGLTLEPNPSRLHKPVSSEQPFVEVPPQPLSSSSKEKGADDSKALVEVPELNVQALSLFAPPPPPPPPPPLEKSKWSENVQRRMRRPFSVSEVEALVQAVQELGTGRWRDVKMRAFENINHRTYVDLKDKWKTLVHTARISPQQRRGEPVPQELLDRVLAAHSYWSHHQAKHQSDTRLLV